MHFPCGFFISTVLHPNLWWLHSQLLSSVPFTVPLTELLQLPAYLDPDQLPACLLSLQLEAFLELLSLALFLSQGVLQLLKLLLWHHVVYPGLGLLQLQSVLGLGEAQASFGFQKL